jgi:hypothetical protein
MAMENCLIIDYLPLFSFFVTSQRNNVILSHPKMVEACTTQIDKVSFGASEFCMVSEGFLNVLNMNGG